MKGRAPQQEAKKLPPGEMVAFVSCFVLGLRLLPHISAHTALEVHRIHVDKGTYGAFP